ncbi:MAG: hypothetical protein EA353_03955 [Puniceicoccaceae bacterium]|nr:MAG: hypothetical protein EA353_03955 [Puniceicoccaceae bacterium]
MEARPLNVFSFNDLHGALCPTSPRTSLPCPERGLIARLAQARSKEPNSCLFGLGDDHAGSVFDAAMSEASLPDPAWTLMHACGVDAFVPGNHDFDWGVERFVAKLKTTDATPLAIVSNQVEDGPLAEVCAKAALLCFGSAGQALRPAAAVFGLVTKEQNRAQRVMSETVSLHDWIAVLPANCPIIILSHLGLAADRELALGLQLKFPNRTSYCLILGAHSHDNIAEPSLSGSGISYAQAGQKGAFYGLSRWDKNEWQTAIYSEDKLPEQLSPTTELQQWQTKWSDWLTQINDQRRLRIPNTADEAQRYRGACPHMQCLVDRLKVFAKTVYLTDRPILAGLCARTLGKLPKTTELDRRGLYDYLPYPDIVAVMKLPLACLPELLRLNAQRLRHPPGYRSDLGYLHFDASLRHETKIANAAVELSTWHWEAELPAAEEAFYFATTEYCAGGAGGFAAFFEALGLTTQMSERIHPKEIPFREWLFETYARG